MQKLLFFISEDSAFCSHRLNLAKAALKAGFEVAIATRCQKHRHLIENTGIRVFPLYHFKRSSLNPWHQLRMLPELIKIYRQYKPDITHHVAMKPVLLGSIVAKLCRVPRVINALGGLGYVFIEDRVTESLWTRLKKSTLRFIILKLFRWIMSDPKTLLILQNKDDLATISESGYVDAHRIVIIPGAGVDIHAFRASPLPPYPPVIITCISRMLWDKGIGEFTEAANILHTRKISVRMILYGLPDPENPTSIDMATLQHWNQSGVIEWRGQCDDVAKAYSECHIAVLASYYREGLPKSLLEAASSGRPIVTTDATGCREVVIHNENGILIPPRNAKKLAEALILLCQDRALCERMGTASRRRAELHFADTLIHAQTLALYQRQAQSQENP